MVVRDPHRFINELDDEEHKRIIDRLESRSQVPVFASLFDKYVSLLNLTTCAQVLEVGCGTGSVLRMLARRPEFCGTAVGVDHCEAFINAANDLSKKEKVSDKLKFQVGDVHSLDFSSESFDLVIAHTLISHVTEPLKVLSEMARVVNRGGMVAIFDGDYASLTYAFPDHGFGGKMDTALANATFNNPRIMRDLPRLLPMQGLEMTNAWGDDVFEIGDGSYFKSFAETYAPYVKRAGLMPVHAVDIWLDEQRQAMKNGTFFAACNYYTYLARRN